MSSAAAAATPTRYRVSVSPVSRTLSARPAVRVVVVSLGALVAACASSSPPAAPTLAPDPAPEATASQVAWLPTLPAAASSAAPSVSASARASSSPAESAAPPSPACAGAALELRAVMLDRACAWQGEAPKLPAGLVVRVQPDRPTVTASGTILLSVFIENTTDQPAVFAVETGWRGLGLGSRLGSEETVANTETPGVATRTEDLLGNELDEPKLKMHVAMLGAITKPALARVELAPHGTMKARVRWRPQGYLPGKDYDAKVRVHEGILDIPPPDPLPKGRYRVRVLVPIAGLSARSVDVTVTGR